MRGEGGLIVLLPPTHHDTHSTALLSWGRQKPWQLPAMAALSAELVILGIREALSTCCGPSWGQRMKYNFWLLGCEDCAHTGVMGKRLNVACTVRGLLSGGF